MNRSTAIVGFWVLGYLALCYVIAALLPPVLFYDPINGTPGRFEGAWTGAVLLAVLGAVLLAVVLAIRWCWRLLREVYAAIERSM